jgi:hypothetical protein
MLLIRETGRKLLLAYSETLNHYHEKAIAPQVISITIFRWLDIYQIYH